MQVTTLAIVLTILLEVNGKIKPPVADIGRSAGLIPDCPGAMKNATISGTELQNLNIVVHRVINGAIQSRSLPILTVSKTILRDKYIDFKRKKTALYAVGFFDSASLAPSKAVGNAYLKRGYNVLMTDTFRFLSYIYPKSVRLARTIGRKLGEMLVQLSNIGLDPDDLELIGISLGAHIIGYASKHYYKVTGRKPSKIIGLDPAGPCFRSFEPDERLAPTDAQKVLVLHTNIDGFGIAEPLGHVDFYANGGEYQPGDIPYIPCLIVCSHFRAILLWWQAVENPKKFIGIKCDSVQDARYSNCYNNKDLTNYMGLETNFNRTGIFYLPTHNQFPYFRGKDGLKEENEIYTSIIRSINEGDFIV